MRKKIIFIEIIIILCIIPVFMRVCEYKTNFNNLPFEERQRIISKILDDGDIEKFRQIIEQNPDLINAKVRGAPPLQWAALYGHMEIVEFLIEKGVDVNARFYLTPLQCATAKGHKEVVEFLVKKGADVNAPSTTGETPLHYAALHGQKDIAEFLIKNGADVNAENSVYVTPLHYAAETSQKEIALLLIENGADVNAKDKEGKTPLDYIEGQGERKKEKVEFLRKYGAKYGNEL